MSANDGYYDYHFKVLRDLDKNVLGRCDAGWLRESAV